FSAGVITGSVVIAARLLWARPGAVRILLLEPLGELIGSSSCGAWRGGTGFQPVSPAECLGRSVTGQRPGRPARRHQVPLAAQGCSYTNLGGIRKRLLEPGETTLPAWPC